MKHLTCLSASQYTFRDRDSPSADRSHRNTKVTPCFPGSTLLPETWLVLLAGADSTGSCLPARLSVELPAVHNICSTTWALWSAALDVLTTSTCILDNSYQPPCRMLRRLERHQPLSLQTCFIKCPDFGWNIHLIASATILHREHARATDSSRLSGS